ncbi:MAG: hypothetical protein RLZZ453_1015 [Chlamydiota bacterium]|jgi:hypothetical protein
MNYFQALNHSLFAPRTYYARYDTALGRGNEEGLAQRVCNTVLPFIALYRPAGLALSVGLGSCRIFSHLTEAFAAQDRGELCKLAGECAWLIIAVAAVAGSVLHFTTGLFISTAADVAQGSYRAFEKRSLEELVQTVASLCYLGFMFTGGLELILISTAIQGLVSLYQSKGEWEKGHYIEAFGKVLLSCVRGYQVKQYHVEITRRNFLFRLQKYQELIEGARCAKSVSHLLQNRLRDIDKNVQDGKVVLSADREYDLGAHLHGFGGGLVKGGNVELRKTGDGGFELEFKLNHAQRELLEKRIQDFSYFSPEEVRDILKLSGCDAASLKIEKKGSISDLIDFFGSDGQSVPVYSLQAEGIGSLVVGKRTPVFNCRETLPNLYNKVIVKMGQGKTLFDVHALLSLFHLDQALVPFSPEDYSRLKLTHLFHTLCPTQALELERSQDCFEMTVEQLREKMVEKAPLFQEFYNRYFHRITPTELIPGHVRYRIEGVADDLRQKGIAYLTATVTGPQDDKRLFDRITSILSMGALSTEWRDKYRIGGGGLSRWADYSVGGADSVFAQLLPETVLDGTFPFRDFTHYQGKIRLLFSLKELELGSYQYLRCGAGNRMVDVEDDWLDSNNTYAKRLNIFDFVDRVNAAMEKEYDYLGHEVMLKHRVPPSAVEGMIVSDEQTKTGLVNHLRNAGLIGADDTILGKAIDQFFRVMPSSYDLSLSG